MMPAMVQARNASPHNSDAVPDPTLHPAAVPTWDWWPTLGQLAALDPRVDDLLADANAARRARGWWGWCPGRCFDTLFRRRIATLVGLSREPFDPEFGHGGTPAEVLLRHPAAHEVVRWAVVDALGRTRLLDRYCPPRPG
jgi:hypothetical protein